MDRLWDLDGPHGQRRVLSLQQNRCQTSMRCVHIQTVILLFPWNLADSHWGVLKKAQLPGLFWHPIIPDKAIAPTDICQCLNHGKVTYIDCPMWDDLPCLSHWRGDDIGWRSLGFHQHRDIFPTSGLSKEQQTWVNWVKLYSWVWKL